MASRTLNSLNRHVLRQALDALPVGALIVGGDPPHTILHATQAAARLLGSTSEQLLGRPVAGFGEVPAGPGTGPWRLRGADGAPLCLSPVALYEQPGRPAFWLLMTPVADAPGGPDTATSGLFPAPDAPPRVRDDRSDTLTALPNRAAFMETLARDWAIARRQKHRVSVVVFRVDELESYQQIFGRHAAEACLRKIAHSIASSLRRAADYCGRVGYDRFAVLDIGAEEAGVSTFAERISQRVRDLAIHHPRSGIARYVTVSYGVASAIPGPSDGEPLLLEHGETLTGAACSLSSADSGV